MVMKTDVQVHKPPGIGPFGDVVQLAVRGFRHHLDTLVRRRAWSKSADRIAIGDHEESKVTR